MSHAEKCDSDIETPRNYMHYALLISVDCIQFCRVETRLAGRQNCV